MTTEQIHEGIQHLPVETEAQSRIVATLDLLSQKLMELEKRIEDNERTAYHANNIASCLANGIIPD